MSHFVRTFKRRKLFLDQLELGSSISAAAAAAGGTVANFKKWKNSDPDFSKDWDDAIESGTDFIEDVALERALKRSDALMAMILKARRPEKFDRAGKLELSGGISVEGSKAKLLNKLARLQAESNVLTPIGEGESEIPPVDESPNKLLALPAPDSGGPSPRGRKRREATEGRHRRDEAA